MPSILYEANGYVHRLGPFAPAGAATAAGTALGFQLAAINAQDPPSFPTGGKVEPDHRVIGVQGGELVASRRASAMPEVREAVEAGNRGERPGGGQSFDARYWNSLRRTMADAYVTGQRRIRGNPAPSKTDHPVRGRR